MIQSHPRIPGNTASCCSPGGGRGKQTVNKQTHPPTNKQTNKQTNKKRFVELPEAPSEAVQQQNEEDASGFQPGLNKINKSLTN